MAVKKFSICFFNEIDCEKFLKFFCNEFSSKKIFNSLKLTIKKFQKFLIVIFRLLKNFLLLNSLQKQFENFLQSISLKKIFENFSENPKKKFCLKKKGGHGGNATFFPVKSDTTFHWVFTFTLQNDNPNTVL